MNKLLLKFMQNSKGTYFELLGTEKDEYESNEQVYGYYISQGYGYEVGSGEVINIPIPPRGKTGNRYSRRTVSQVVEKPREIVPNMSTGRFRITRMKEFYNQEPLDWRNDNYYSNQIYTLNADNLNTIIEPEFGSRVKVITTKPKTNSAGEGEPDNGKYKEQEMIGFYTVKVGIKSTGGN